MENHEEDIFYSDDELSDSELFQVKNIYFTSSFLRPYNAIITLLWLEVIKQT